MRTIIVNDVGPAGNIVIPVQPGGTILSGYCGTGKSITLEAIALGLGSRDRGRVAPREGAKRSSVDCLGVVLNVSAGRVTRNGESEVASLEEFDVGSLIDPPVKDYEARNRHGIKSLLRMTQAQAEPALFYHLAGGKAEFDAMIPPAAVKSADLVDMAGKIKRAFEAKAREAKAFAEREEAAAAADRNAGDGLNLDAETNQARLQEALETAAGIKSALDERARSARRTKAAADEARQRLAEATGSGTSLAECERLEASRRDAYKASAEKVKQLESQLAIAKAEKQAAYDSLCAAEEATAAVKRTQAATAGWQAAIDAAAGVREPSDEEIDAAIDALETARRAIETAAVVRAAKERIAKSKRHQEAAAKARQEALRLNEAAKATDAVLSAAVASERFSVSGEVLFGKLPDGEPKPYYDLSDGERTLIATAEKIDRVRASEPDESKLAIIDLPQRTFQDIPESVRKRLFAQAAEHNVCIVTAQVSDDKQLRADVVTVEGV